MTRKLSKEELVNRMHQARAFSDPIVGDFLDLQERKTFDSWRNPETTLEKREELYKLCQGLEAFRKFVKDTIIAGKNAEIDLERQHNTASK
jgi:hypothetical protein